MRFILPAIRGELAKTLVNEQELSQKEAAKLLGITEAAISQYLSKRRGNNVALSNELVEEIKKRRPKKPQIGFVRMVAAMEINEPKVVQQVVKKPPKVKP